MIPINLVVFDMVGTTVEASPKIPEAFLTAFANSGIELTADDVVSIRGKSKRQAIAELLADKCPDTPQLADQIYDAFKSSLLDRYRHGPVNAIAGAEATFRWCQVNGIGVALTTGFDRELAMLLVDKLGWGAIVDTTVCNDDVANGRPAPDLIMTAMERLQQIDVLGVASVGDTVSDLEAGANAGTGINVGVLSGAHTRQQLLSVSHTALIDSVADLPALLV